MVYARRWPTGPGAAMVRFKPGQRAFTTSYRGPSAARAAWTRGRPYRLAARWRPGYSRSTGIYGRFSGSGTEWKFHDVSIDNGSVPLTGSIQNGGTNIVIPQNANENGRIGRKITIKHIQWKGTTIMGLQEAVANPPSGGVLRCILYLDMQTNGTTASVTEILQTTDIRSHRSLANQGRFKILWDKKWNMNYQNMSQEAANLFSAGPQIRWWEYTKNVNIPVEYDNVSGALGTIRSNNLAVLLIATSTGLQFFSNFRVRYTDK